MSNRQKLLKLRRKADLEQLDPCGGGRWICTRRGQSLKLRRGGHSTQKVLDQRWGRGRRSGPGRRRVGSAWEPNGEQRSLGLRWPRTISHPQPLLKWIAFSDHWWIWGYQVTTTEQLEYHRNRVDEPQTKLGSQLSIFTKSAVILPIEKSWASE